MSLKSEDDNTEEDDIKELGSMARMLGIPKELPELVMKVYLPMVEAMAGTLTMNFNMITSLKLEVEECKQMIQKLVNRK